MEREKDIEAYLVRRVKELGGVAFKFVSPGHAGVPDRLVCLPGGLAWFVELKAPGKKTRPWQDVEIRKLRELGFRVFVADSREQADEMLNWARSAYDSWQASIREIKSRMPVQWEGGSNGL